MRIAFTVLVSVYIILIDVNIFWPELMGQPISVGEGTSVFLFWTERTFFASVITAYMLYRWMGHIPQRQAQ